MHRAGGETGGRDGGLPLWGEHTHASHEHHHTDKVSLQQVTPRICLGRTGSQRRHLTVVPRDARLGCSYVASVTDRSRATAIRRLGLPGVGCVCRKGIAAGEWASR